MGPKVKGGRSMRLVPAIGASELDRRETRFSMLKLAEFRRLWVHRRGETIEFPDDETIRRTVRLDFTMPPDAPLASGNKKLWLVPFAELKKKRHVHFEIRDDNHRLPMITLTETADFVSEGLPALGEQILNRELDPNIDSHIRDIAGGTRPEIESSPMYPRLWKERSVWLPIREAS
jgi:hypothetical protein